MCWSLWVDHVLRDYFEKAQKSGVVFFQGDRQTLLKGDEPTPLERVRSRVEKVRSQLEQANEAERKRLELQLARAELEKEITQEAHWKYVRG